MPQWVKRLESGCGVSPQPVLDASRLQSPRLSAIRRGAPTSFIPPEANLPLLIQTPAAPPIPPDSSRHNATTPEATLPLPIKNKKSKIVIHQFFPSPAPPLSIPTAELTGPDGKLLIDHFAITPDLRFSLKQLLPKESDAGTCPGKATGDAGFRISDHTGIVAEILPSFAR